MTTHYETLGVEPDADAETIRRAYKRAASVAHPDRKGGSDERMAEVNRSYMILADPHTRAFYDKHKRDPSAVDVDARAADILLDLVHQICDDEREGVAVIHSLHASLIASREDVTGKLEELAERIHRTEERRDAIRSKNGQTSLLDIVFAKRLELMTTNRAEGEERLQAIDRALVIVDLYEDVQQFMPLGMGPFSGFTVTHR